MSEVKADQFLHLLLLDILRLTSVSHDQDESGRGRSLLLDPGSILERQLWNQVKSSAGMDGPVACDCHLNNRHYQLDYLTIGAYSLCVDREDSRAIADFRG